MGTNATTFQTVGRVASDIRTQMVQGDRQVTGFIIAVDDDKKKQDGTWEDNTQFYWCDLWGKLGESAAKKLEKGDLIFVTGRLKQSVQTDPKSGQEYRKTKVWADSYRLLQKPKAKQQAAQGEEQPAPFEGAESMSHDDGGDVPF